MNKHLITIIIISSITLLTAMVSAQSNNDPEELPVLSFLETQLEGRNLSIKPTWEWQLIPGRSHTYSIKMLQPDSWEAAYLCVDGAPAKRIKPNKRQFKWTFERLEIGSHEVGLLILGADNQAGYIEKKLER